MTDSRQEILAAFDAYCAASGLSHSTVSARAANKRDFYERIRGGADCTMQTYANVMKWFQDNRIEDTNAKRTPTADHTKVN